MSSKSDKIKAAIKKSLSWAVLNKKKASAAFISVATVVGYNIDPVAFQAILTILEFLAV